MKKFLIALFFSSSMLSCKKNLTNPNSSLNSYSDTCGLNPLINFNCIGTPIGKFAECIKDVDGNVYKTVKIGTQQWMAENLKVSKYNDGSKIINVINSVQWSQLSSGAWVLNYNDEANNTKYGKLYNWYAVSPTTNGDKNVCPAGWHVPSKAEWKTLIDYLGGEEIAGGKMKEVDTSSWIKPNTNATNSSLFTALPSSFRSSDGSFNSFGIYSYLSSISEDDSDNIWSCCLNYYNDNVIGSYGGFSKKSGISVRCLKD